ncbi:uncharacterized protein LOC100252601 isoform X2 [Vitis vinifera]|uniref:uncharacterized protein LOC100252601 isoform X2 n=1 Tax=Vitis vinifera TaxID=29760 RepID=UPI0008FEC03B|nr:uncharacterized protein LOC100252601 isoform X2 [Vitis vinifera]|eukprot:XP_019077021.1 PREDICTED: uncharacterized protein LOC100252601 isoform X2 [Vitis vinifera]
MVSSLLSPLSDTVLHSSPPKITVSEKPTIPQKKTQLGFTKKPSWTSPLLQKSIPLAASVAILLWSNPEENQKKYAEFDERFKSSPLLKELLERSKLNQEKNRKEIQDKYCIRGAEWGVGDCSVEGMSPADKDNFIATLKQKLGDGAK